MIVALSFDDGYLRHLKIARLLNRLKVRATFYCITHLKSFGGKATLAIDPENFQEIADLGHEVGSHTCTHPNLTELPINRLDQELKLSKRYLENIIGTEVLGVAYPYGLFNANVLSTASKYYHYGRSAAVYQKEDLYNVKPPTRNMISALSINDIHTIKCLPRLFLRMPEHDSVLHPCIIAHDIHPSKLMALVLFFRSLGANFVTVRELVEDLARKCLIQDRFPISKYA